MPFGAVAGALISGITGSNQSGAISQGQQQANAVLAPFSNTGVQSNTQTANLLGLNGQPAADAAMSTFQSSPGYQFTLSQGEKAVDAGAAASGMLRSGATLKAEQSYGQGLANQDFQQYVTNLNSLSGMGINAANGQASTDTSAAGQQASIYGSEGSNISKAVGGGVTNALTSLGTSSTTPSGGTGSGGNLDPYSGLSYQNA